MRLPALLRDRMAFPMKFGVMRVSSPLSPLLLNGAESRERFPQAG